MIGPVGISMAVLLAAPPAEGADPTSADGEPASAWTEGDTADPDADPEAAPAERVMSEAEHAEHRRNYGLVVAGDVMVGLGVGGFIAMVAGFALGGEANRTLDRQALRDDPDPQITERATRNRALANGLVISGGASAGALIVSGVTMIAVGTRRETLRRERAESAVTFSFGPSRGGASATLRVRF